MRLWDTRTLKCSLCHEGAGSFDRPAVHAADLHPNQNELIGGDAQGKVIVWDLAADKIRRTFIPDEGVPIRSLSVAPDARTLACANHEGMCYVWRLGEGVYEAAQKIQSHGAYVLRCLFSPESKHLATASADHTTNLWVAHEDGLAQACTLTGHERWVWDCAFTNDGQYLATGSSDCTCRLWDVTSRTQRLEFSGFKKGILAVAMLDRASAAGPP
mmetsp:Transcript_97345/g.261588  ORF Transcript_97345/g.261588 Transcript_97345/m.261588 type:complete len:215 (-) Transcript_97345:96-740(-)